MWHTLKIEPPLIGDKIFTYDDQTGREMEILYDGSQVFTYWRYADN